MRGARGKHEDSIGESNRLVDVVGDEHGDHAAALDEPRQIALQLPGERRVERNEGLVEQQQGRANGERARQRCAPRQADREFARKMRPVLGEAERGEQGRDLGFARVGRGEPHVVLDAAPRQESRLLKNHAHSAMRRDVDRALEIAIEAGENAHQRRLAAAGRPDQRAGLAFLERERKIGDDRNALSRGGPKGLSRDARFKPRAVANARHDVQRVAPRAFR